jgi:hypothetical protein
MVRRQSPPKGIILLIVVSLLALFVLIGVTYVLVGGQYRRAATMASRTMLLQIDPQMQLDRALYQVVRDTMNPNSAVHGEGLLLDMYGPRFIKRNVTAALLLANNQYLDMQLAGDPLSDVHGRVLTFLSGPLKNHSTRIVSMPGATATAIRVVMPIVERVDLALSPLAPLPVSAIQAGNYQVLINGPAFRQEDVNDPNEDYDAVDRNNMALAALIPSKNYPDEIEHVIPSYYRPTFAQLNNVLPVDNDGDGVPDSGWVDMGFPVQTDASGRRYRPYFAVLCLDMDGRLNLNAHGSLMQAMRENGINSSIPMPDATTPNAPGTTTILLPKGQGYGPPEINLSAISRGPDGEWGRAGIDDDNNGLIDDWRERFFRKGLDGEWGQAGTDDDMNGTTDDISEYLWPGSDDTDDRFIFSAGEYSNLLVGENWKAAAPTALPGIPGRYGANDLPGRFLYDDVAPMAFSVAPLIRWSSRKFFEYPDNYFNNTNVFSSYRSLADLNGELAMGISHLGQPVYERPRPSITVINGVVIDRPLNSLGFSDTRVNNPYEFNLAETKSSDNRFTVAELERVLRSYDVDSDSLPDRLTRLIPRLGLKIDPNNVPPGARFGEASRRAITTDSYDLPVRPALPDRLAWSSPSLLWSQLSVDLKSGRRLNVNKEFSNDVERKAYIRSLYLLAMEISLPASGIDFDGTTGFNVPGGNSLEDHAYGLAQWAVNVVDFRDADSIMTRFVFDPTPFDANNNQAVVWGCERPELLITETVAWHDRATEDLLTTRGKVPEMDPVDDFDQRLMPRSGFFVELYNPWQGDDDLAGNGMQLDLKDVTTGESPVWQLVVVRGPTKERDLDDPNPAQRPNASHIERCIYFTNPPNAVGPFTPYPDVESWYQDIGNNIRVLPGHYAVIGSRGQKKVIAGQANYFSYLGRTVNHHDGYIDDGSDTPTMPSYDNAIAVDEYDVTRQVQLVPGTSELFVNVNSRPGSANLNLKSTVALPINRRLYPSDGTAMDQPGSLTITEPVGGYLDMNYNVVPGPQGEMWLDGVGDDGAFSPPLDRPLDEQIPDNQGSGLNRGDLDQNGTIRDYAVVHLRRLANHLLPYHPTTNPYRTIDSMSVDVTRFNGADGSNDALAGNDPVRFHGLQRGDRLPHDRNIWRHEKKTRDGALDDPIPGATSHHFNYDLIHSLGYLNERYHPYYLNPHPQKGEPHPDPANNRKPFPWLTWFNRPFVSQYDLMLVPHSRSSRLLIDFTVNRQANNPYEPPTVVGGGGVPPGGGVPGPGPVTADRDNPSTDLDSWPFAHLINFFESQQVMAGRDPARLHEIFDYTYVPSRFLGTAHWLNPVQNLPNPRPVNRHLFFREPGKLNINTIFDPAIWDAYLDGHEGPRFWGNSFTGTTGIAGSRRGFGVRGGPMIQENPADPGNFFTTPFRTNGDVMASLLRHDVLPLLPVPGGGIPPMPGVPGGAAIQQPLFETYPSLQTAAGVSHDNARDATRNAYFYYQGIQRMGNLITTRSNVYAIWITVGFFGTDAMGNWPQPKLGIPPNPEDEIGFETGEIDRHRAFYMFDRSIPVACEPGKNHNVDQAIVLRRYLE